MLVAPGVRRILAPNPSLMTGRGTNSYLFGNGEVAVVDPGPDLPEHVEALIEASRELGTLTTALVTHWHSDHLPAALTLKRRLGVRLAGHASLPGVNLALEDGARCAIGGVVVRAVATPGHTADHQCYLLEADQVLFSGDHIAGEGTVVINPPDGNMAAYLDSLRVVLALNPRLILPGHGPPIEQPTEKLIEYLEHRLARERQVLTLLADRPRTVADLVAAIYREVPPALHPVAARSVLAHLLKLEAEGRARPSGAPLSIAARQSIVWEAISGG